MRAAVGREECVCQLLELILRQICRISLSPYDKTSHRGLNSWQ